MGELGQRKRFLDEVLVAGSVDALLVPDGMEDLDAHRARKPLVDRAIHDAGSARFQPLRDHIAVEQAITYEERLAPGCLDAGHSTHPGPAADPDDGHRLAGLQRVSI